MTATSFSDLDIELREHPEYAAGQRAFASVVATYSDEDSDHAIRQGEADLGHALMGGALPGQGIDLAGAAFAYGWIEAAQREQATRCEAATDQPDRRAVA